MSLFLRFVVDHIITGIWKMLWRHFSSGKNWCANWNQDDIKALFGRWFWHVSNAVSDRWFVHDRSSHGYSWPPSGNSGFPLFSSLEEWVINRPFVFSYLAHSSPHSFPSYLHAPAWLCAVWFREEFYFHSYSHSVIWSYSFDCLIMENDHHIFGRCFFTLMCWPGPFLFLELLSVSNNVKPPLS